MAAQSQPPQAPKHEEASKQSRSLRLLHRVEKDVKPLQSFLTKFNNDWVMNLASGLAFNILTSLVPIIIAIVSVAGFFMGLANPAAKAQIISGISRIFPGTLTSNGHNVLTPALNSLSQTAGVLGIIAVLLAIFSGSRLFVTLEGYFDIIYHTRSRNAIPQNIMAVLMMLLFMALVPLMVVAGSGPALVFSLLTAIGLGKVPGINLLFGVGGFFGGIFIAWIFFVAIYIVVPNQRISFRKSWLGALVAAVLVQIYLTLFPFYATHFLKGYGSAGVVGLALIFLLFLYYFSVILLLGAEINAYFAEGIRSTPANVPTMIHQLTSHLSASEQAFQAEAAASHKDKEPEEVLPQSET
ncbi:MAG TPA: YihY/virulence factor BrkB family protein [Ktedonobacteraceae bacterium]|nr:YihY/virulence factor BrkB family protein [Ktedonobacteraceae bacterium]